MLLKSNIFMLESVCHFGSLAFALSEHTHLIVNPQFWRVLLDMFLTVRSNALCLYKEHLLDVDVAFLAGTLFVFLRKLCVLLKIGWYRLDCIGSWALGFLEHKKRQRLFFNWIFSSSARCSWVNRASSTEAIQQWRASCPSIIVSVAGRLNKWERDWGIQNLSLKYWVYRCSAFSFNLVISLLLFNLTVWPWTILHWWLHTVSLYC